MGRRSIRPSAASDAERLVNSALQQGRELTHINPFRGGQAYRVTRFLSAGARAAGAAAEIGGDEAAVAAAEGAGEGLLAFGAWPFILLFIAVLIVLRLFEGVLVATVSWMPLGIGSKAGGIVRIGFTWLDSFENWVMAYIDDQIKSMMQAVVSLVGWCLSKLGITLPGQGPAPRGQPGQMATEAEVRAVNARVDQLNKEVQSINFAISNPLTVTGPVPIPVPGTGTTEITKTVVVGVPQNLWDQIHAIHAKQANFEQALSTIQTKADQAYTTALQALNEGRALSQSVHAIRAVTVGYQDIQRELENLGSLMTSFVDETATELQRLDGEQKHMAPLGLLLGPGLPGLRNLRTLEDNMCQCPKLPNIPRLHPELLAMYEFVTNG